MELFRSLATSHPSAATRDLATYYLAQDLRLLARYEEAAAASASLGFIDAWSILGAFDNDQGKGLSTVYAPELPGDLRGEYQGARLPIRWRPSAVAPYQGSLSLGNTIWPADSAVAYAETFVTSPRKREILISLSTSNDVRAWINGRLVISDEKVFHDDLDNVVARVVLEAGTSRLLIKSAHGSGGWRLGARFTEIDGKRPVDLTFSRSAPGASPAIAAASTASPAPAPKLEGGAAATRVAALADVNRRRFLQGRLASKIGHTKKTPQFFQPMLDAAPKNPAAMYFTAVSHWDTGEAGKALDLLNAGVAAFPRPAAFPIQRARFYKQRRLFDKAQKDLEAALRAAPRSRDAFFELSHVHAARGWPIDRCRAMDGELALWPDTPDALFELSQCKGDQGLARDAELYALRAAALLPGDATTLARVARLAQIRLDDKAALSALHALRAALPAAVDYVFDEADLQRRAGHDDEAKRLFEIARAQSPDSPRAYAAMASMAYASNHIAEATKLYRLALERDPDDASLTERVAALDPAAPALGERLAPSSDEIERVVRSAERVTVHGRGEGARAARIGAGPGQRRARSRGVSTRPLHGRAGARCAVLQRGDLPVVRLLRARGPVRRSRRVGARNRRSARRGGEAQGNGPLGLPWDPSSRVRRARPPAALARRSGSRPRHLARPDGTPSVGGDRPGSDRATVRRRAGARAHRAGDAGRELQRQCDTRASWRVMQWVSAMGKGRLGYSITCSTASAPRASCSTILARSYVSHSSGANVAVRATSSASRKGRSESAGGTTFRFFASRKSRRCGAA